MLSKGFFGKFLQVGFDAVRVFKKRNKALKKIHKLIKKGKLQATEACHDYGLQFCYSVLLVPVLPTPFSSVFIG